eukprot:3106493-Pleurochrysis_carterae.AAC.1
MERAKSYQFSSTIALDSSSSPSPTVRRGAGGAPKKREAPSPVLLVKGTLAADRKETEGSE